MYFQATLVKISQVTPIRILKKRYDCAESSKILDITGVVKGQISDMHNVFCAKQKCHKNTLLRERNHIRTVTEGFASTSIEEVYKCFGCKFIICI